MGLDLSTTAMGYAIIDRRSADLDEIGEVKFRGRNWLNRIPPMKETLAEIVKSRVLDEDRAIIEAAIEWFKEHGATPEGHSTGCLQSGFRNG